VARNQLSSPVIYLGADPGATGGFAILCGGSADTIPMPRTEKGVFDYLSRIVNNPKQVVAGMEQVTGFISKPSGPPCPACHQTKNRQPGSAMFEFGTNYGMIRMGLTARGLGFTKSKPEPGLVFQIPPQEWQRGLKIDGRRKGESDSDWKNRLLWNAQQFFPNTEYPTIKITLRTADALLMALYTKRLYTGTL